MCGIESIIQAKTKDSLYEVHYYLLRLKELRFDSLRVGLEIVLFIETCED